MRRGVFGSFCPSTLADYSGAAVPETDLSTAARERGRHTLCMFKMKRHLHCLTLHAHRGWQLSREALVHALRAEDVSGVDRAAGDTHKDLAWAWNGLGNIHHLDALALTRHVILKDLWENNQFTP